MKSNRKFLYGPALIVSTVVLFLSTYSVPVEAYNPITQKYSVFTYPILLFCCGLLTVIYIKESSTVLVSRQTIIIAFTLVFMFISYTLDWEPYRYVSTIIVWHVLWVIFFILFTLVVLDSPEQFTQFITQLILIFAGLSTLIGVVSTLTAVQFGPFDVAKYTTQYPRLAVWFVNPNFFASLPASACLICFHKIRHDFRYLYILLLLAFAAILFWTSSRGVMLALLVGLFVYLLIAGDKTRKITLALFSVFIPVIFLLFTIFLGDVFIVFDRGAGASSRLHIWRKAIPILADMSIPEHIFGNGHGYFSRTTTRSPHNGYVRFIINYGAIFFLLYMYYVIHGVKDLFRSHTLPSNQLWASMLIFILVRDITDNGILFVRIEGFLFSVLVAYLYIYRVSVQTDTRNRLDSH